MDDTGHQVEGNGEDFADDLPDDLPEELIAVVGLAGRYPESPDLDAFWDNLRNGRDCLHTFTDAELDDLGIPESAYRQDNFVRRGTVLPDRDNFDARFFGFTPKQAGVMDPQARIFLETCYEALEHAGYNPFDNDHSVGVFAGSNPNDYALLLGVADPTDSLGAFDQMIGVDRDFIATRVSHSLGLTGPAMTIQTACSTSLVTVHAAAQALLAYECSMALAGGVSINLRQGIGYFYQPGMILSPTGECRAFDADAQGTTLGQGCGVAVLKRLEDAKADGDHIMAVVRATALNNDGKDKISYTAPSEDGQAAAIAAAHAIAGVDSDSIGYVETHGTGTLLGDPIEVAALTRAFRAGTNRNQYCAIGSAKTNFGHTDAAAGITGFIKAVLSLYHREIVPSIHFDKPNPDIDFANTPFYVSTELKPWAEGPTPRRAGVSAFGIGGTNAHVVLEEAPPTTAPESSDRERVLLVSAKTPQAADRLMADVTTSLAVDHQGRTDLTPARIDHTLRRGRPTFDHRRAAIIAPDGTVIETPSVRGTASKQGADPIWMFAGQGAQYPRMGLDLYRREPVFAEAVDRVANHLQTALGIDLRTLIFSDENRVEEAAEQLRQTSITQPALFAIEHAMACLLRSWGAEPSAVIGHSIGEYAAAVEAGILSWSDAATVVAERGRLMQAMEPGAMVSVSLPAAELIERLPEGAELAADNSSALSVASGPSDVIEALASALEADGVSAQLLHTSHAFHSEMMTEAAAGFAQSLRRVRLSPPKLPLISNVTGRAITDSEAVDPDFWASQIRRPVRFAECVANGAQGPTTFIELGPGRALSTFVSAHAELDAEAVSSVPTMRHPRQDRDDRVVVLEAMAKVWAAGTEVDWDLINDGPDGPTDPVRVPLATYPFDREEHWQPPHRHVLALPHFGPPTEAGPSTGPTARETIDRWLYAPSWQLSPSPDRIVEAGTTIVLAPAGPDGDKLVAELAAVRPIIEIRPGGGAVRDGLRFTADPDDDESIAAAFAAIRDLAAERELTITSAVHAWHADPSPSDGPSAGPEDLDHLEQSLSRGVHSVLACARGLSPLSRSNPVRLDIITTGAFSVVGDEMIRPDAAALVGPTKVIPLEYSGLTTRLIDLPAGIDDGDARATAIEALSTDASSGPPDAVLALRHGRRWTPTVAVRPTLEPGPDGPPALRHGGRYLIVGGLGGVGLSIARFLAERHQASIILTSRRGRPTADPSGSDPETARRIELLDEIEAMAADLSVAAVDATDEAAMGELVSSIEAEQGPINGVIVAAGVADQQGAIHRRSRADMTTSLSSKVHGSVILERVFADRDLDFLMLSSSIAATLYHNRFAQVGYVTGNAFAEAFSARARQRGIRACTVAWDDWLDIGMSVRAAQDFSADFGTEVDLVDRLNSFAPAEGVELFRRALATEEPVLLVSPTDLGARIDADVDVVSPFLEQATGGSDEAPGADGDLSELSMLDLVTSVWSGLLGFESFETTDDFFEIGGDSLQAARMADRLSRSLGVDVPIDAVFESPTLGNIVAVLDELVDTDADADLSASATRVEPVVLGPAQRRFVERGSDTANHFNVSTLLRPDHRLEPTHVEAAVADLYRSHDALRLTLTAASTSTSTSGAHDGTGTEMVLQLPASADASVPDSLFGLVDLTDADTVDAGLEQLTASATEIQTSLDLFAGPVFRTVLYELPEGEQRLLLVIHHLMTDRVSLLMMLDTLDASLRALGDGSELKPAPNSTSVLDWVEAQAVMGQEAEQRGLVDHWNDRPWDLVKPLPTDKPGTADDNRNDSAAVVELVIGSDELPDMNDGDERADELVLMALLRALAAWSSQETALVDVLGHGRRLPVGVDVSRSVGMFITYAPTLLDVRSDDRQSALTSIRSDLEHGWSFDALRFYGTDDVRHRFGRLPRAEVLFNWVGKAIATDDGALLKTTDEPRGPESDSTGRRAHLLAVRADVLDDDSLKLVFVYSTKVHEQSNVVRLAKMTGECLRELRS